jgi:ABC-2 type transport system permease protein
MDPIPLPAMPSNPRWVILDFVARRSLSGSFVWGSLFALTTVSSAVGFTTAFTTAKEKAGLVLSFGNNVGLKAMLGLPHALDTAAGFTQWRALGLAVLIGSAWGIMQSTKLLRGDEDEGRWELLLSGITSQRRAVAQALGGMGISLIAFFALVFGVSVVVGTLKDVGFSAGAAFMFAIAMTASPALFMAVGAFASQVAANRRQAAAISSAIFGILFLLRALADSTTGHDWLRDITPFGWIENLQPLTGSEPIWLIPLALAMAVLIGLTVYLAGKRDMGDGFIKEAPIGRANLLFLNSAQGLAFRLTRGGTTGWILVCALAAAAFGGIAKSAAQAFSDSQKIGSLLSRLSPNLTDSAATFLGLIFMILMILVMVMAAGSVIGIREEEASGHLDNLLVRPVSRLEWLAGRIMFALFGIMGAGLAIGLGAWLATQAQSLDFSLARMLLAGLNTIIPAAFLLGLGILAFGFAPRLVSTVSYGFIALSFLIVIVASALNVGEWVLNLSILHHMQLAPATDPDWQKNLAIAGIAILMACLGTFAFVRRDIAAE